MIAADGFCELLRVRLSLGQHRPDDLALLGPAYRTDALFLEAADYAEAVVAFSEDRVGGSVVLDGALRTAALAFWVWVSTTGGHVPAEEDCDGDGDC